jgi:hypothetical protein
MRALILIAGAALMLAACGKNNQSGNTTNVDENLTAQDIVSNDVTAIDAVTGDAANMAADVNYMNAEDNSVSNLGSGGPAAKPSGRPRVPAASATENTTANSTATTNTGE